MTKYLSIRQAAAILGEGEYSLRERVKRGEIAAYQIPTAGGSRIKIDVADLSNFLNRCRVQASA
jgi:excisionase family DNA binding protein